MENVKAKHLTREKYFAFSHSVHPFSCEKSCTHALSRAKKRTGERRKAGRLTDHLLFSLHVVRIGSATAACHPSRCSRNQTGREREKYGRPRRETSGNLSGKTSGNRPGKIRSPSAGSGSPCGEGDGVLFYHLPFLARATLCAWPVLYKRWMHSSSPAPHSRTNLNLLPPFQSTSRSPTTR